MLRFQSMRYLLAPLATLVWALPLTAAPVAKKKSEVKTVAKTEQTLPHMAIWFKGDLPDAFAEAKKSQKPIFAVWGAVWCPSCAELKNSVFADESFPALVSGFIPLYLDGDTPAAQALAEKLGVFAYPTTIVMNADGKEFLRISELVSLEEFRELMTSFRNDQNSLTDRIQSALAGKATADQWRILAYTAWDLVDEKVLSFSDNMATRLRLIDKIPAPLEKERAVLASGLLMSAAQNAEGATAAVAVQVHDQRDALLGYIFKDDITELAARAMLVYGTEDVVPWLEPDASKASFARLKKRWLRATTALEKDTAVSLDQRLWASQAEVIFFKREAKGAPIPPAMVEKTKKVVADADRQANNYYQRHAVIASAARALREVGDYSGARALLDKELKTTDTPWYLQSSYANVEKAAGRPEQALRWSQKARLSAQGTATKIQWTVSDAQLLIKFRDKAAPGALAEVLKSYYEMSFGMPDGFQGRNAVRAKTLAKDLAPVAKDKDVAPVIAAYQGRCETLAPGAKAVCSEHFSTLRGNGAH